MSVKAVLSLFILIAVSAFLRFTQLGYSSYYGDETKTLYLDKTVPAVQFLLNQRKGPLQFLVTWFMEKVTGGYDEFWIRIPYAIAGLLAVTFMYLLLRKLFDWKSATVASALFSVSGFFVAFSRTAQYQSLLVALGLASLYFLVLYFERKKVLFLILSSVLIALAFYAHYDAVFFAVPFLFLVIRYLKSLNFKHFIIFGVLPFLLIVGIFYIPYFLSGYYVEHTSGYLSRRLTGSNFKENFSPYTFYFYNPTLLAFVPLLVGAASIFVKRSWKTLLFLVWFLVPFILFEFVFSNPGTHILNYTIPLYGLVGNLLYSLSTEIKSNWVKSFIFAIFGLVFALLTFTAVKTYVPAFNNGYPFETGSISSKHHLFVYGMPYNRQWREVQRFMYDLKGVRGVYSNDNDVAAEYYLMRYDYTRPGDNFLPQYYIKVLNSMEGEGGGLSDQDLGKYLLVKEFYTDGILSSQIYRLNKSE